MALRLRLEVPMLHFAGAGGGGSPSVPVLLAAEDGQILQTEAGVDFESD